MELLGKWFWGSIEARKVKRIDDADHEFLMASPQRYALAIIGFPRRVRLPFSRKMSLFCAQTLNAGTTAVAEPPKNKIGVDNN